MAKLIKVSDTSAYKVEAIKTHGKEYISIRKMYATKSDPTLKPAKQGVTIEVDSVKKVLKAMRTLLEEGKFTELE